MLHKNTAEKFSFDDCKRTKVLFTKKVSLASPNFLLLIKKIRPFSHPAPEGVHREGGLLEHGHRLQLHHGGARFFPFFGGGGDLPTV